jgi:hypothetical protein
MVYLPPHVVIFCAEEQRTFWDVHRIIDKLIADNTIEEDDGEFLKCWLCAVTQGDPASPQLGLDLLPAINANRDFVEWSFHHLDSFLGAVQIGMATPSNNGGSNFVATLQDLTSKLQPTATPTTTPNQTGKGTSSKDNAIKPYSQYDVATIKDFCGITRTSEIPVIWTLFKTSKDNEDH